MQHYTPSAGIVQNRAGRETDGVSSQYGKGKQTDRLAAVNRRFLPRKPTIYFINP
jgi:hypothetical protein